MKIRIKLTISSRIEVDRQTIEANENYTSANISKNIHDALKAWKLAPGDTIVIEEVD